MKMGVPIGPAAGTSSPGPGFACDWGLNDGGWDAITWNKPELTATPPGVTTTIDPDVAVSGTMAWIWRSLTAVKVAAAPLIVTDVAPKSPEPLMRMRVFRCPPGVVKLIVGVGEGVTS